MQALIFLSFKRLLTRQLAEVQAGRQTIDQAKDAIHKARLTRPDIIEHLTRDFDQELADTLSFFSML